ncbi:thermonuclease family protein [Kordiimonas sp.]|uniref:thermonuclease family protein n=1 Tax=Kordiimonas sp. TaxID=1970157 RepID=UPI003A8F339F
MLRILAILFLILGTHPLAAQPFDPASLKACGSTVAGEAISGARFKSAEGQTVKIALVKAPELWAPDAAYKSWPYGPEAKAALDARIRGKIVTLYCEGPSTNRLGELVAHVVMENGDWLALDLVREGHVFVFPGAIRRHGLTTLFQEEEGARNDRRGLWRFSNLDPVEAQSEAVNPGWFQIIRGQVQDVSIVRGTYYINFGEDWRTDFTIEIPPLVARQFAKQSVDPMSLKGERVEGRGWVDFKSGPRLLVQGPGQLRQLPALPSP